MRTQLQIVLIFFMVLPNVVIAQIGSDTSNYTIEDLYKLSLDELLLTNVYSASKNEENILKSSGTVYTISKEEIDLYGWTNLREILSIIPNMDLGYNYDYTFFGQRGFHGAGQQTLILVNGNTVNRILNFDTHLKDWYMSNEIERIEVYMGPNSTLYGTSAIYGVINIITRNYRNKENNEIIIKASGGTGSRFQQEMTFNKAGKDAYFGGSIGYLNNQNNWEPLKEFASSDSELSRNARYDFARNKNSDDVILSDECISLEIKSGIKGWFWGYRLQKQISTQGMSRVRYQWGENQGDLDKHVLYTGYDRIFNEKVGLKSRFSYRRDDYHWLYSSRANLDSNTINNIAWVDSNFYVASNFDSLVIFQMGNYQEKMNELKGNITFDFKQSNKTNIKLGSELSRAFGYSAASAENRIYSRNNLYSERAPYTILSSFLQVNSQIIKDFLFITGGLRLTYNEYGDSLSSNIVTPRLSIITLPSKSSSLKLTYNQGYRVDFYSTRKAEQIDMLELNYTFYKDLGRKKQVLFSIVPYLMKVSNPLMTINNPDQNSEERVIYSNGPDNRVYGLEAQLKYKTSNLSIITGGRWVHPQQKLINSEQDDENMVVKDVPLVKFKGAIAYDFNYFKIALTLDYWSETITETYRADYKTGIKYLGGLIPRTELLTEKLTIPSLISVNGKIQSKQLVVDDIKMKLWLIAENILNRKNYHSNVELIPVKYLQHPFNIRAGIDFSF